MIVQCNVWCVESDKNHDLGLPDGDCWMPIAINFKDIQVIKEAGENEFIGQGKASVYLSTDHFVIDIDYKQAVMIWKGAIE